MILHVSVAQWMGATFVECHWEDDYHRKHFVARRKLQYGDTLTPYAAINILRDELPFLSALEQTHPTL